MTALDEIPKQEANFSPIPLPSESPSFMFQSSSLQPCTWSTTACVCGQICGAEEVADTRCPELPQYPLCATALSCVFDSRPFIINAAFWALKNSFLSRHTSAFSASTLPAARTYASWFRAHTTTTTQVHATFASHKSKWSPETHSCAVLILL